MSGLDSFMLKVSKKFVVVEFDRSCKNCAQYSSLLLDESIANLFVCFPGFSSLHVFLTSVPGNENERTVALIDVRPECRTEPSERQAIRIRLKFDLIYI